MRRIARGKNLGTTWVDRRKGDECRSRLCVQDFAHVKSDDNFAPTPTDETTRILEAFAVHKKYKMRTADVSSAFLHADEEDRIIVRPPEEWRREHPGKFWLLKKALYGRRTPPKRWNKKLTAVLESMGVMSCDAQPSLFYCKETDVAVEVHVDDFDIAGPDEAVEELVRKLQQIFLMKVGEPWGPGCSSESLVGEKCERKTDFSRHRLEG